MPSINQTSTAIVDLYNYFSIELLETIGLKHPSQDEIDQTENILKKMVIKLTEEQKNKALL